MNTTDVDVVIVGAGLSGIGTACHLRRNCPEQSFALLERRQAIGGTWDLFRYPGIRSDSDMCTFGYSFRPWNGTKVLADGESIRGYIADTAREYDVEQHIRFGRKVTRAEWSTAEQVWTVTSTDEDGGDEQQLRARFVVNCSGYYNYDQGYTPAIPGAETFAGQIVHPQHWPENLDYAGKKVVVIGSGATAITLVPSMAGTAAHVTMLQRTPTYILSVPSDDPVARRLNRFLPEKVAYTMSRARNIGLQRFLYQVARSRPRAVKRLLRMATRRQLGSNVDLKHFSPPYNPWDQRLCVVPDGDLFKALRKGQASIVTDQIDALDATGIRLKSGEHLDADIVITATGLNIQMFGGASLHVDGAAVKPKDTMVYRGCMVEGVPNLLTITGYTNASWTLKADLVGEYLCRLLQHMQKKGYAMATPAPQTEGRLEDTVMGSLSSGYVQRGSDQLPRQGANAPWRIMNDYIRDIPAMRFGRIDDGVLRFRASQTSVPAASTPSRSRRGRNAATNAPSPAAG